MSRSPQSRDGTATGGAAARRPGLVRALLLSSHPVPGAAVTVLAVVLGISVGLPAGRTLLLGLVVLLGQLSIGWSNDWIDAARDAAVGRADKPLAQGWVDVTIVRWSAIAAAAGSVLLAVPLGWPLTAANVLFLASAWAYNAGLKSTPASVLPYLVSFGMLPALATLARVDPALPAAWAVAVGALLGASAHFANVLPDLDDDRRTGVRGLPHRMGRTGTAVACAAALLVASLLAALTTGEAPGALQWSGLIATAALTIVLAVVLTRRPGSRAPFVLIILAALLNAGLLAAAGTRLIA